MTEALGLGVVTRTRERVLGRGAIEAGTRDPPRFEDIQDFGKPALLDRRQPMKRVPSEDLHCTAAELAEMLDVSIQRVGQLRKAGILEKEPDGLYDRSKSVHMYGLFVMRPDFFREML